MKTSVLGLLLVLVCLIAYVSAAKDRVIKEPKSKSILSETFSTFKAEYGECIRNRQNVYHRLAGEKTLNAKNDREIEMIKKLLQMMKVGVHGRHAEKDSLIQLLTKLLKRLLAQRATNLTRIAPLQEEYNSLREQCQDRKKDHDAHLSALKEIKAAIANQQKLVRESAACSKSSSACSKKQKALVKSLNAKSAALKKLIAKYEKLLVNREKCKKSLASHKNKVANVRANNGKLIKNIKDLHDKHNQCRENVANTDNQHDLCQGEYQSCKTHKSELNQNLETLQDLGDKCTGKLQTCQKARLLHAAACKKTTDKATGLERRLGSCQNSKEHCNAKLTTNSEELPKCTEELKKLNDEINKLAKEHKSIADELAQYKPPVKKPGPVFPPFKPKYPTPSNTKLNCYSTGDPHYRTFEGRRYDLYQFSGYYNLLDIPGEFTVETLIQRTRVWSGRGLNRQIGVRLGPNAIYGSYATYTLNGKPLNLGVGKTLRLNDGSSIRRTGSTSFSFMHSSGSYVNVGGGNNAGIIYHNVYVYIPRNWRKYASGLCTSSSTGAAVIRDTNDVRHIIGSSFVKPVIPKNHNFNKIAWKSAALKASAHQYCQQKLKLTGSQLMACLLDAKVAGSVNGATAYKGVATDLTNLEHLKKVSAESAVGHTLREVSRMRTLLEASSKRLGDLYPLLEKVQNNKNLIQDIKRLSNRLGAEHTYLEHLQADLTNEVLNR